MNKQEAIEEIKQADERLWQFAKPLGGRIDAPNIRRRFSIFKRRL